jgi:hypothetical protein
MANKSITYLLPLLSEVVNFNFKFFENLEDVYLLDDLGKHENCMYLLYDFSSSIEDFTEYEQEIIDSLGFLEMVDVGNKVLYIFKFPEDYIKEYALYKEGKYSQFSKKAKKLIMTFYTKVYKGNLSAINYLIKIKQVLFKSDTLRRKLEKELNVKIDERAELTDACNIKNETFLISEYIKNIV